MSNIIQIAYTTEGTTDERFLGNIIEKTFEDLLFESDTEIEIHSPVHVIEACDTFKEKIRAVAIKYNYFHVICIHCDSDDQDSNAVLINKINPAFDIVKNTDDACKNLVAVIPVQMTEAWMLADIDLLLTEINTDKTCGELNLPCKARNVETIADPKTRIKEALRAAQIGSRRRSKLSISNLYTPISQKLTIRQLEQLPSFRSFKEEVRRSLIKLNYLH
jgi:hypothetical protein